MVGEGVLGWEGCNADGSSLSNFVDSQRHGEEASVDVQEFRGGGRECPRDDDGHLSLDRC